MKKIYFLLFVLILIPNILYSQSGNYLVQIRAIVWYQNFNNGCSNNHFEFSLYENSSTNIANWRQRIEGRENQRISYSKAFEYNSTKILNKIDVSGHRAWKDGWPFSKCVNGTGRKTTPYNVSLNTDINIFTNFQIPNWNNTVSVKIAPSNIILALKSNLQDGLTSENKTKIEAPDGYVSIVYKWVYKDTYDGTPKPISNSALQGSRILNVDFKDIYGDDYISKVNFKSNTWIALEYRTLDSNGNPITTYSDYITLSNKLSAPHIQSVATENVKCPGESDGAILITLDREILDGEELTTFIKESNDLGGAYWAYSEMPDKKTLRIPNLSKGTYLVQLNGNYNGASTYSEGVNHKKENLNIEEPTPISFSLDSQNAIACNGGSDGSFKVKASGGASGYKLMWRVEDTGNYTEAAGLEVTGLPAGIYEYYVVDANNCKLTDNEGFLVVQKVVLTESDAIIITHLEDKTVSPSGNGLSSGYITIQVEGGTPDGSGNYTVVWKNKTSGYTITTVENSISNGKFESKLKDIPAGDYTVTITDSKGCIGTIDKIILDEPFTIRGAIRQDGYIACPGETTASLSVVAVSGGVPNTMGEPYILEWYKYNGSTYIYEGIGSSISTLGAGTYKVTITDNSSPPNTMDLFHTISEPNPISVSSTSANVSCYNGNNGLINVVMSGGTKPYKLSYSKDNGSYVEIQSNNSFVLDNLGAGVYDFWVTDNNNCSALIDGSATKTITITQPAEDFVFVSQKVKHPSGAGRSDGSIVLKVTGGIPFASEDKYTTQWRKNGASITAVNTIDNGVFTTTLETLPQGRYSVSIFGNTHPGAQGPCILTFTVDLEDPKPLSVNWSVTQAISCKGESDGEITANANGGIKNEDITAPPYKYSWYTVEEETENLIPGQSANVLSNIGAGKYKVVVIDYSSPSNEKEFYYTLTEPDIISVTYSTTAVSCYAGNNGSIKVNASGGTGPYNLFYKNENETAYTELHSTGAFTINNLVSGDYDIYVTDKNGCSALINGNPVEKVTVTQPEKGIELVSRVIQSPSGEGRNDGYIILKINGGTPFSIGNKYRVTWKNNNNYIVEVDNYEDADGVFTTEAKYLSKGEYAVEIKDANGSCSLSLSIVMDDPKPMFAVIENTKTVDCYGDLTGELVAHVTGGVKSLTGMPYMYSWYKYTENHEDIIILNTTDSILSGLGAGVYYVFVKDFAPNENTLEEDPFFEITQPALLRTTLTSQNVSCFGGSNGFIHVSVSGGVGGYQLHYEALDTDAGYQTISANSDNRLLLDNLTVGRYNFYVQDANGCIASVNNKEITEITLTQPDKALAIDSTLLFNPSKYGAANGSITLQISGGTPGADGSYNVVWRNGRGQVLTANNTVQDGIYVSQLGSLGDGEYSVEIRDANYYETGDASSNAACIVLQNYKLVEPEEFLGKIEEKDISCYGQSDGALITTIQGGVRNPDAGQIPYKFRWYIKEGDAYRLIAGQNNYSLTNIPAGDYRVEIEDYSWLPNLLTFDYSLVEPDELTAVPNNLHITCGQTAIVSVEVSGGTPPYAYQWSTGDATPSLTGMYPGIYMVFIKDAKGCDVVASVKITSPGEIKLTGEISHPLCFGSANGKVTTAVSGGTAPYTYAWSNGSAGKDLLNASAGIYTVVVTDRDGCSFTESFTLIDPKPKTVDLGEDKILCLGQTYELAPEVDDPATKFEWTSSNGFKSNEPKVVLDRAGTYRLLITDSQGCQATDEMTIEIKNYDISSEMAVASQVALNDTVVIVNISYPEPDNIEWLISPDDPIEVVETTPYFAMVIFKRLGDYEVGMRTHVADCFQDIVKTIHVSESGEEPGGDIEASDIKKFIVYPNPNSGEFNVDVELEKPGSIRLRLISLARGIILNNKTFNGQEKYAVQYNETLAAGSYILLLETASSRRSLKIIIY
ncbi:hypothetical protein FACS189426_18610 [Bacteroidia bacterium]|nr:hypothetical protein FACS189426_18610 [Bacteroidia bacterium]